MSQQILKTSVGIEGQDQLELTLTLEGERILSSQFMVLGCPEFLTACREFKLQLKGDLKTVPLPKGSSHSSMLLREALLRLRGDWECPYQEQELCHCRAVPLNVVDRAVVGGAHDVASVSRRTSAGTSCGSCQPDILRVINWRLNPE